jgi:hypothetical protein
MPNFINSFRHVPVLLFRLNTGKSIKLRERSVKRSKSFDVLSEAGKVYPKALDPATYRGLCLGSKGHLIASVDLCVYST